MRRRIQRPHAPPRQSRHVGARPPTSARLVPASTPVARWHRPHRLAMGRATSRSADIESPHVRQRPKLPRRILRKAASMSRRADCAAARNEKWISIRAGSAAASRGTVSSSRTCWTRKLRCARRIALALARNSGLQMYEPGPAMRGLLRRGRSEEPAAIPRRLRGRGRGGRDRAVAAKEAVMTITHPLRDIASGGVVDLSPSILSPGVRASQACCRSCPSSMFAGDRQEPLHPRGPGRHGIHRPACGVRRPTADFHELAAESGRCRSGQSRSLAPRTAVCRV